MDNKKNLSDDIQQTKPQRIITSANSPALAEKMKKLSAYFIKVNEQLYKDLANK